MRSVRAVVDSAIRIQRRDLSDKVFETLRQRFSVPNPEYVFARRLRRTPHGIPSKLYTVEEFGETVVIPRGLGAELRKIGTAAGVSFEFEDRRALPPLLRAEEVRPRDGIGYLYQKSAALSVAKATQGYVVLPCGGGKTTAGVLAIAETRARTIVLVPTNDLVEQWVESTKGTLPSASVGVLSKGHFPITIATVQTFRDWEPERTFELFARFGMVILDEAHHIPAYSFRRILNWAPCRYRLGLTATPEREDGLTPLLPWYLGPIVCQKSHQELVDLGVLVVPSIRVIGTEFSYNYKDNSDWSPMCSALVDDPRRNALIVHHVEQEASKGCVCLVLSNRVEHCESLAAMLCARGIRANAITSAKTKKQRKALIASARGDGTTQVLCATSLADEGLDLPILSRVFLVFPGRAKARTTQRLGRLMRPHADKPDPILFDLGDVRVPHLRAQLRQRFKLYQHILGAEQGELPFEIETTDVEAESAATGIADEGEEDESQASLF